MSAWHDSSKLGPSSDSERRGVGRVGGRTRENDVTFARRGRRRHFTWKMSEPEREVPARDASGARDVAVRGSNEAPRSRGSKWCADDVAATAGAGLILISGGWLASV